MRVTAGGTRLIDNMRTGMVASGKRYSRPSALLPTPNVVWNGNPLCPPGCVLYLPGLPGSGANTYDYSGQKLIGAITGAVWTQLPSGIWVLSFDGDDRIRIPYNAVLQPTTTYSWTGWIYPTGAGSETIFDKGLTADPDYIIQWDSGSANGISVYNGTAWSNSITNLITINQWQHIALSWDGTNVLIYINGIYKDSLAISAFQSSTDAVWIGVQGGDTTKENYFNGKIGEVWQNNSARTAGEVMFQYLTTKWRYL